MGLHGESLRVSRQMLPFYKDRDTPVHRLHPAAKMATVLAIVLAALVLTHPNYLLALLIGTVIVAAGAQVLREWWAFMRLFAFIALTVVIINALVSSRGETTFWEGPYIWGFGQLSISARMSCDGSAILARHRNDLCSPRDARSSSALLRSRCRSVPGNT
ncbi:MAG: energy-coupling factor transporter transmembrane protein EcfT, partial [Candidatus Thermoplasmatota archaeon]|nr:energy-coupling factor transporter transmembrane protein EcfT [Candidatus Thermoplasmatota archaeon]